MVLTLLAASKPIFYSSHQDVVERAVRPNPPSSTRRHRRERYLRRVQGAGGARIARGIGRSSRARGGNKKNGATAASIVATSGGASSGDEGPVLLSIACRPIEGALPLPRHSSQAWVKLGFGGDVSGFDDPPGTGWCSGRSGVHAATLVVILHGAIVSARRAVDPVASPRRRCTRLSVVMGCSPSLGLRLSALLLESKRGQREVTLRPPTPSPRACLAARLAHVGTYLAMYVGGLPRKLRFEGTLRGGPRY